MGRQRRMEKKNKTLGAEKSENIDTQYINKIVITIIIINDTSRVMWGEYLGQEGWE